MYRFGATGRYWLVLVLLIAVSFLFLQKLADYSLVRLDVSNSHSSNFKVYWTTEAEDFWSESRARVVYVNSRKDHFVMPIPVPLSDIVKLRIDPNSRPDVTTIVREIGLYHLYTKPVIYKGGDQFSQFVPNQHVEKLQQAYNLKFISTGNDAWFTTDFPELTTQPLPWLQLVQAVMLGLLLFSFGRYLPWLFENLRWVPIGLLIAACAALAMATLSARNTHPDETIHISNASYYAQHYAPAQVCADDTRYTYSDYGISRLNNREIAYVAGGRYLQLVDFVPAHDYLKLRFFNISLFFILVLLAFRQPASRIVFLPILLTPQAWYLFSYYNSDALSLFAVMLAAYQLFAPESILRRFIRGERPPGYVLGVLGVCLLVAMQFWVKLNYVFYPLFLGMLAVSWWLVERRLPSLRQAAPALLILVVGTAMFLSWELSRHAVNDFAMSEKISACQEETARPAYKPSTALEDTHYNVRLREKGYTLENIVVDRQWPRRLFYTALGAYGYTEYLNHDRLYQSSSFIIVLLLLYVSMSILIKGDAMARLATLSSLAALLGVSMAALWMNWTMDFQPQGRYLMVYLPVLGSLMALYSNLINRTVLSSLAGIAFIMAMYSYFAVGLVEIAKG